MRTTHSTPAQGVPLSFLPPPSTESPPGLPLPLSPALHVGLEEAESASSPPPLGWGEERQACFLQPRPTAPPGDPPRPEGPQPPHLRLTWRRRWRHPGRSLLHLLLLSLSLSSPSRRAQPGERGQARGSRSRQGRRRRRRLRLLLRAQRLRPVTHKAPRARSLARARSLSSLQQRRLLSAPGDAAVSRAPTRKPAANERRMRVACRHPDRFYTLNGARLQTHSRNAHAQY